MATTKNSFFNDFKKIQEKIEIIGKNAKGYNYKYTDLPMLWEKTRKIISDNNFIIFHKINKNGVRTIAQHIDGTQLQSFIPFTGILKPQDKGSEISYYRRYNIQAIFNIVSGDEDDDAKKAQDKVKIDFAKIEQEVAQIKTIPELRKYHKKNAGKGKEVAEIITKRAEEIKNDIPIIQQDE